MKGQRVPKGRLKLDSAAFTCRKSNAVQSSLRDFDQRKSVGPNVETLGSSRMSLRDEDLPVLRAGIDWTVRYRYVTRSIHKRPGLLRLCADFSVFQSIVPCSGWSQHLVHNGNQPCGSFKGLLVF